MDLGGEDDEGNKIDSLWELMKEIRRYIVGVDEGNRWSCQVCDYTCLWRVIMLFMEPSLISSYHPSSGESIWVKKTYPY
jgi:hypothetical protein